MEPRAERPTWYTVKEAAAILRMSSGHIVKMIRAGQIPGRQVGKAYRVDAAFCHPTETYTATWPKAGQ